jgi:glutamine synthetase
MSRIRIQALQSFAQRQKISLKHIDEKISDYFASDVFTQEILQSYLSRTAYTTFLTCITEQTIPDYDLAEQIATAMKSWAIKRKATHYSHWFQPLTGITAEKQVSFFLPNGQKGIEEFSGNNLIQQEPDRGDMLKRSVRATFEARGYNTWDITSPPFLMDTGGGKTLCIPTKFVSYTGESLDHKMPLLRSIKALNYAATDVCNYFNRDVKNITATVGWEQEYYLIDSAMYYARPDLQMTGRTLSGRLSTKGQQREEHYFGAIPERIYTFMRDFEEEAHRLGIPLRTRHNEVAPSQFECAPMYEELNLAVDHNQMLMDIMDRVSGKHKLKVLFHEKPFDTMVGSSKHINWSLHNDEGKNLLKPGTTPRTNLQFLTFFINTIAAINRHESLLRASVASHGNDRRLGSDNAPPAILSVYIGKNLTEVIDMIEKRVDEDTFDEQENISLRLDLHNHIPEIILDNTDSNRTAPVAFTGDKFEFRAAGSSVHCALPLTVFNAIVADQLTRFKNEVDIFIKQGDYKDVAILKVLSRVIKESRRILYEGDNYSEDWEREAEKRGLSHLRTTPVALDEWISADAVRLFEKYNILHKSELQARYELLHHNYIQAIKAESLILGETIINQIIPAALRYQNILLENVKNMKGLQLYESMYVVQNNLITSIAHHIHQLYEIDNSLSDLRIKADAIHHIKDKSSLYCNEVKALLEHAKFHIDELESFVEDSLWPLPKYREMLFIK